MLDCNLWHEVSKASLLVKQWIVLADWNQFGAIVNTYCGSPVEVEVKDSDLLWGLTQGSRWVPTENKRSDPVLFEFIQGLVSGRSEQPDLASEIFHSTENLGQSDLDAKLGQLALARAKFPLREGPCRYSLSISHHTRMQVNREANLWERRLHPEAVKLECEKAPSACSLATPAVHRRCGCGPARSS